MGGCEAVRGEGGRDGGGEGGWYKSENVRGEEMLSGRGGGGERWRIVNWC